MLAITVRFLHGTFRAGSPEDTVMTGTESSEEWPPSPARLFSALVAADGTRDRCHVTNGSELAAIERLGPPVIEASEVSALAQTSIPSRFVVKDERASSTTQNYPARTAAEVRPGIRLSPPTPVVRYLWESDLGSDIVQSLRRRAARIGYLGCADSPVQVTVSDSAEAEPAELPAWRPGTSGGVPLPVPYEGFLAALDTSFDAWSNGEPTRRSWVPNRWAVYGIPSPTEAAAKPTVVWLEFDRSVPGRRALSVTETLRNSVLELIDAVLGDEAGPAGRRAPWILHGHDIPESVEKPYQLARYLPLLNVGHKRADGSVHGAAVWLPAGTEPAVIELVRSVLFGRLRRLHGPGFDVAVTIRSGAPGKISTRPDRWSGPSRRWTSVTPVVAERGRRGGPTDSDVKSWFTNAGHPTPERVRVSPVPITAGAPRLRGDEVHRPGRARHPFYWLDVYFQDEIQGPLCIGRSRSFGIGLLAPVPPVPAAVARRSDETEGQR